MSFTFINKREIVSTPFASQLDGIDKALFEYCYRKQTQQYNNSSHHNHQSHHNHNHNHNHNLNSKHHHHHHHNNHNNHHHNTNNNNKFGNNKNNRNNSGYHYHSNGNSLSFGRANTPSSNGNFNAAVKYQHNNHSQIQNQHLLQQHHQQQQPIQQPVQQPVQQSQVVVPPRQGISPAQQIGSYQNLNGPSSNLLMQHPQPLNFSGVSDSASASLRSSTSVTNPKAAFNNIGTFNPNQTMVSSPDSFAEDFINPTSSTRLPLSVAGSGTLSASGSTGFDFMNSSQHLQKHLFDIKPTNSIPSNKLEDSIASNISSMTASTIGSSSFNGTASSLSPSSNVKTTSSINFSGFNGGNEFNNSVINHRSGWLNIWGNDMSVWA